MTGKRENDKGRCGMCGGSLKKEESTTVPFVFGESVVVVRDVPAEVCGSCGEPFMSGEVTDQVIESVEKFRNLQTEVSVVPYRSLTT